MSDDTMVRIIMAYLLGGREVPSIDTWDPQEVTFGQQVVSRVRCGLNARRVQLDDMLAARRYTLTGA